jgi:hypothetical protein
VQDKYRTITHDGNIICGNTSAGNGKPVPVHIDRSNGEIRVADCSGLMRKAGWVEQITAPMRHKRLVLFVLALVLVVAAGFYYFCRGRRVA